MTTKRDEERKNLQLQNDYKNTQTDKEIKLMNIKRYKIIRK